MATPAPGPSPSAQPNGTAATGGSYSGALVTNAPVPEAAASSPTSAIPVLPAMPEDTTTAETAAAAAALVVDSVVESVINNNNQLSNALSSNIATAQGLVHPTIFPSETPIAPAVATPSAVGQVGTNSALPQQPQQALTQLPSASTTTKIEPPSTEPPMASMVTSDTTSKTAADSSTVQTYNQLQKSKRKERLEQNRISARESRKRKKSMIEELQRTVMGLTAENKELNGRNQSLRSNLADIGRKYPNSAAIQAILNGMPTPSPQHRQQQTPIEANPSAGIKLGNTSIPTNYLLSQQQLTAAAASTAHAIQNASIPVVPIMASPHHPTAPQMVVPYMYIPHATHASGGLMQLAVPRHPGQQVVPMVAGPQATGAQVATPLAPPPPSLTAAPTTAGVQQHQQQQQHIVIALQPAPAQQSLAPIQASPQAPPILPAPVVQPPAAPVPAVAPPLAPKVPLAAAPPPTMEEVPNPMAATAAEEPVQSMSQESLTAQI